MPEFTHDQRHAIAYLKQDACVVAGPGSGKTTVLVERYSALIRLHGFDPRHILAITFTEKAAANMKAKLAELFAHDQPRLRELESAYVSTIHGFCGRILREHAIAAGIDPRFSVLDARESEELQYSCLNTAFDELVDLRRAESLQLIDALHKPDLASDLKNVYDAIRSAGKSVAEVRAMPNPGIAVSPGGMAARLRELLANWTGRLSPARMKQRDELLDWARKLAESDEAPPGDLVQAIEQNPLHLGKVPESEKTALSAFREDLELLKAAAVDRHTAFWRTMIFDVLARFEELYAERKRSGARLDFNDLECRTIALLRDRDDVRNGIRGQFRQVMLDEFQDINERQAELIRLVRGDDVFFGVGDINQSIYGFRHARPEIFEEYQAQIRDSGKHSTHLLHNFRSRGEILHCVKALLDSAEGIEPRDLIAGLPFPAKRRPSIEVLKVYADEEDEKDAAGDKEARWIAHRILSLRATLQIGEDGNTRAPEFRDFAILCRNGESMRPILDALDRKNIPYVCGRRQSFLLSREGLDITALLHIIDNPRDGISLVTVLRSNLVGIGDESLLRIRMLASSLPSGLNVLAHDHSKFAGFAPEDERKLARFAGNLKRWREAQSVTPFDVLIVRALSDCGFEWTPGTTLAGNVESFLHLARVRGAELTFPEFLHEIESLENAVNLESDLSDADQGDCVQVMTAHSAKGLEFPVTIVAAMQKGTQRNSAPATFTPDFGLGLKWKGDLSDSWQLRNEEALGDREKREANRLLYVAMTRAEEHLILSWTRGKTRPSNWAKLVEKVFQLDSRPPSDRPQVETVGGPNGATFEVAIHVTDTEPPLVDAHAADARSGDDVPRIPRPVIEDQHDSTVNVTSLTVFADCPRKYYLQRYIGWNGKISRSREEEEENEDEFSDLKAADLGSMVHEILAGKQGSWPGEAERLAGVFLGSDLGRRAARSSRSEREWEFIVDIGGTLVRGTIDLWFEENGEIVVVDYKTDTEPRAEAYFPQLALYGLAIERAFGKRPAEAWLHFLRAANPVKVPLDNAAFERVRALLANLARAQDTLDFVLREGERCRACEFHRGLCPAGARAMTASAPAMPY